jgi:hypothetical protein
LGNPLRLSPDALVLPKNAACQLKRTALKQSAVGERLELDSSFVSEFKSDV